MTHSPEHALTAAAQNTQIQSDAELHRLFTLSLDLMCVAGPDGRFRRVNPAFAEALGFSEQELLSRPFLDFIHPDDVEATLLEVARLRSGAPTIDFENRYRCADGGWKWMSWRARADQQGNLYAVARDETERHRIEQMKRGFVSTVSHELRTPLTALSGSLELIDNGVVGEVPATMAKLVSVARQNAKRLLSLVNDLLDLDRMAAGKIDLRMQSVDLGALLRLAVEANQSYAQRHQVQFKLITQPAAVQIKADPDRFLQVMSNLLSNAAKFSPADSEVIVGSELVGGMVTVEVRDQGCGIPLEFQSRTFERFAQADTSNVRQHGGSGLGLAIAKELTELMSGQISFRSTENQGTTFCLSFPALSRAEPKDRSSLEAERAMKQILVVDDDRDLAQLLVLLLNQAGYAASAVHTARHALDVLRTGAFHAAAIDLMLPDMSGAALIRAIREQPELQDLPLIVVSAVMHQGRLALGSTFLALDWLAKPVDQHALLASVERAVRKSRPAIAPRVLHVEDEEDLRSLVVTAMAPDIPVDGAATLRQARALISRHAYTTVVLDLSLPDGDGASLIAELRALQPAPSIVVLSGRDDVPLAIEGVHAVLLKARSETGDLLRTLAHLIDR